LQIAVEDRQTPCPGWLVLLFGACTLDTFGLTGEPTGTATTVQTGDSTGEGASGAPTTTQETAGPTGIPSEGTVGEEASMSSSASSSTGVAVDDSSGSDETTTVIPCTPFELPGVSSPILVAPQPRVMSTADLDGDGNLDLVVAGSSMTNSLSLLRNDGDGIFTASTIGNGGGAIAIADLNSDGSDDIVTLDPNVGYIRVFLNVGDGTFDAGVVYMAPVSGNLIHSLAVGDIDGDGVPDLLAAGASGDVSMLPGNGDGTFAVAVETALDGPRLALADIDDDGDIDVATPGNYSLNLGDGIFDAPLSHGPGMGERVVVADLGGDAKPDIVVTDYDNRVHVKINQGDGFAPAVSYEAIPGDDLNSLAVADLDGDGHLDLAFADAWTGWSTLLNTGLGAVSVYQVGAGYSAIQAADFNGDSATDLAAVDDNPARVTVLFNCPQ